MKYRFSIYHTTPEGTEKMVTIERGARDLPYEIPAQIEMMLADGVVVREKNYWRGIPARRINEIIGREVPD